MRGNLSHREKTEKTEGEEGGVEMKLGWLGVNEEKKIADRSQKHDQV
jgi:hypothetical protein